MSEIDLQSADPAEVYAAVQSMDPDRFDELMGDEGSRATIIGALIEHMAGLFRPEKAGDLEALVHIKLWDKPGGGYDHFELRIADADCSISAEPAAEPDITLKVRPSDLRALLAGDTGARRLAFKGRLRVLGDLRLAARLPDLFAF